jgi:ribose 5-phosphate isomerase B
MEVFIASDHAGFERKQFLVKYMQSLPHIELQDLGPFDLESVDYPDYANKVCSRIKAPSSALSNLMAWPTRLGILICGSGQGMAMRANKFPQIRAALCWNEEVATLSREHNDANVLCMGSRTTSEETAIQIVNAFLKTPFAQGRHARRVVKVISPV